MVHDCRISVENYMKNYLVYVNRKTPRPNHNQIITHATYNRHIITTYSPITLGKAILGKAK